MSSSISSILLKEKQVDEEINTHLSKIKSKIDKYNIQKNNEKNEFIIHLEEQYEKKIKNFESEIQEKCAKIIKTATTNSKNITFKNYYELLVEKINKELDLVSVKSGRKMQK